MSYNIRITELVNLNLMVERVRHGSLTLHCCFFSLLYPSKYFIHSIRTSIPFNLIKDGNKQNNAMSSDKNN